MLLIEQTNLAERTDIGTDRLVTTGFCFFHLRGNKGDQCRRMMQGLRYVQPFAPSLQAMGHMRTMASGYVVCHKWQALSPPLLSFPPKGLPPFGGTRSVFPLPSSLAIPSCQEPSCVGEMDAINITHVHLTSQYNEALIVCQ